MSNSIPTAGIKRLAVALITLLSIAGVSSVDNAASASTPQDLVIKGTGSAYTDIFVQDPIILDQQNFTYSTDGVFAGFLIEDTEGQFIGGGVAVPEWDATGQPWGPVWVSNNNVTLDPGEYRIHLLSEGQTTVKIPIDAVKHIVVRTKKPVDVKSELLDLTGPVVGQGEARIPVHVSDRSYALVAALEVTQAHALSALQACLVAPDTQSCLIGERDMATSAFLAGPAVGKGYGMVYGVHLPPTIWGEGDREILIQVNGAVVPEKLFGFYLLVTPK